ncbi:MAG: hypothetical protein PUH86_10815, partial [Lachnospiraceae bacterium]|nr:hypothetical protein [Lachnospiraceae bacterium]
MSFFISDYLFFRKNQTEIKFLTHSNLFQGNFLKRKNTGSGGNMKRKNKIVLKFFAVALTVSFLYPFCSLPLNAEEMAAAPAMQSVTESRQEEEQENVPEAERQESRETVPDVGQEEESASEAGQEEGKESASEI